MDALILAAGFSKRLEPLTLTCAKPLLPVGGRPMVERVLEKIQAIPALQRTFLVSNGKFHRDFVAWGRRYPEVTIVNDGAMDNDHRLGPIRDIELVIRTRQVADDLLIVAGDNLFDASLADFAGEAGRRVPWVTIGIVNLQDRALIRRRYGVVQMAADGRISAFFEKPDDPPTTLVSTGIYYFPAQDLRLIGAYLEHGGNPENAGYLIQSMVQLPGVYGAMLAGRWFDIGDRQSYEVADNAFGQGS